MTMLDSRIMPSAIPLSMGFDQARLDRLKGSDPLEIVAQILPGAGSHGTYTENAIRRFVSKVQLETMAGYLGHTKPDDFSYEWRAPAVHWIGASWSDGRALIRGVVDAGQPDLKRLIREGRIDSVSIFYADPKTTVRGGDRLIDDLTPISIDISPRDRQGQPGSRIVAWGELDGKPGTREALGELVTMSGGGLQAVEREFGSNMDVVVPDRRAAGLPVVRVVAAEVKPWIPPAGLRVVERSI
jgi:hypothetical protein